jgi:hypothetical protein
VKLLIEIDLDRLPAGTTKPNELGAIVGELRDWLEKLEDVNGVTRSKTIRNFESEVIGSARIAERR